MIYRLKDRELQRKLDDMSNGDFSKALDISAQRLIDVYQQDGLDFNLDTDRVFVDFGNDVKVCTQQKQFRACFEPGTIEERKEYNPKAWNKFPDVEPPEDILMRVERSDGYKTCAYFKHFEDGSNWMQTNNLCMPKNRSDLIDRFRPWDDEDEE